MANKKPARAGSNTRRSLDAIAADLHRTDRQSMFDIGKLLTEARDACEHGDWQEWLEDEENGFRWSYSTALNYISAHELASKYRTVQHLRVPARIIYELAEADSQDNSKEIPEVSGVNDPAMPGIIEALVAKTGKKKKLTYTEAKNEIGFAVLRHKWGNFPDETLNALDALPNPDSVAWNRGGAAEWVPGAIDALKREKPSDEDAADGIVNNCYRKYLERLYGGALPTWVPTLASLENVEAEHRPEVRRRLNAAKEPLDFLQVSSLVREVKQGRQPAEQGEDEQGEPPVTPPEMLPPAGGEPLSGEISPPAPKPQTKETDQEKATAAAAAAGDVGSKAEIERLKAREEELLREKSRLEKARTADGREIERLEAEIKELKAGTPKLSIEKLIAAMVVLLKQVSREKARETLETLCVKLGVDPQKLSIDDKAA
jgi:DUF3102 family protein